MPRLRPTPLTAVLLATAALSASAARAQTPPGARHAGGAAPHGTVSANAPASPTTGDAGLSAAERTRRAQPVAHVGATVVTLGELEDMLNEAPAPVRQSYADPRRRREFLENMLQTVLLADEARTRGIDRNPDVASAVRRILAQRLEQVAVISAVTPESVPSAEVEAYYRAHQGDYNQPEYRRATAVFVADRAAADQVAQQARAARGDMRRVQALVRERSTDEATREHDGDLYYFRREGATQGQGAVDPAIAAAAFQLEHEMDVSPPVPLADGRFAVVVLTGMRPALSRTLEDVGVVNSIRGFIVRERRAQRETQLLEDVRARLHPEVHEERVDLIRLPPADLGNVPGFDPAANGPPRRPPTPGRSPVPPPAPANAPVPVAPGLQH